MSNGFEVGFKVDSVQCSGEEFKVLGFEVSGLGFKVFSSRLG